jgi:hypothetical protein
MHASLRNDSQTVPPGETESFATSGAPPVRNLGASCGDKQKPSERYDNEKDRKIENPRGNTREQNDREKTC